MKKLSLLLICLCTLLHATAQYNTNRNKIWAFGNGGGVDFTSGVPVSFTSGMNTLEGCASVCNTAGNLLFYTNGRTVYNRFGAIMSGGAAIVPFTTNSTSQAAVIVPFPNDANKYYVFSLEEIGGLGRLAYSVVDMTLAGGLGNVPSGSAGIILNTGMSEKMTSVAGNNCNVWLLTHKEDSTKFLAYSITSSGVSTTPIVSNVGSFAGPDNYSTGLIKCSHDRQKIVSTTVHVGSSWGIELYDFNPATGIVSNCQVLLLNPAYDAYGAEFSPDNTKLYVESGGTSQWDISLPTTAAIIASRTSLTSLGYAYGDLKLGIDGKIYIAKTNLSYLDRINFPNTAGTGCGYATDAVNLAPNIAKYGLPNVVWSAPNPVSNPGSSTMCSGTTTTLSVSTTSGVWISGSPTVATVSPAGVVTAVAPGTAVISYSTGGTCDGSAIITVVATPTITGSQVCVGSTAALTASTGVGTWTSGNPAIATVGTATGAITGISAGTTVVTFNGPGCPAATSVVSVVTTASVTGGIVCAGATLSASSSAMGGSWTSGSPSIATIGSSSGMITGVAAGTAMITYSAGSCINSTTVTVSPHPSVSGGAICEGASATLSSTVPGGTWTSSSSSMATVGLSSGVVTGVTAGITVITYTTAGCSTTAIVTVTPSGSPGSISLCAGTTTTLTGSVAGGTWSSSNTAVATAGLSSGVITGLAIGTSALSYLHPASCQEIIIVNVIVAPDAISGKFSLCEGLSTSLICGPSGGTWSSSSPNATITAATGILTGVTAGTATITYTLPNGCHSTATITVDPLPSPIAGLTTVALGGSRALSDATAGGTWSSSDTTKAKVNSSGIVTGVALGTATIYYILPTGCKVSVVVTVVKNTSVAGMSDVVKPTLYPNPTTNEITINAAPSTFSSFVIYNALGQEMMKKDIISAEIHIDVTTLPPGQYQVVLKGDGAREMVRFVKW